MSNETKRDVLEKLIECYAEVSDAYTEETGSPYYCDDEPNYLDEYDAALPDDLPVIPKAIGEYITSCKARMMDLHDSMFNWLRSEEEDEFMVCYSEIFAIAWVLGVWRIEENGEIVKLEAEK